jgi:hypothetical protein
MRNRSCNLKTPPPRGAADATEVVGKTPGGNASLCGGESKGRKSASEPPIDIARELETLHTILSKLQFDDPARTKMEDSFMEARVACALTQPDRTAVGDALNRGLKTARRAEDFESAAGALRPHVERAVTWLGADWQRILAVVR